MALTPTEESQIRQLIAQEAALLSLAGNEPTITSKLGAAKVNLSQLPSVSAIAGSDLFLLRQGTTDRSSAASLLMAYLFTSNPNFASGKANNGYQKLPSGVIFQWGQAITNSSGMAVLSLPIAFPTAYYTGNVSYSTTALQSARTLNMSGTTTTVTGYLSNAAAEPIVGAVINFFVVGA